MEEDYNVQSETGRLAVWDTAFQLISENPITGVGANCFPRAFGYKRNAQGRAPVWIATHNAYLQIWSEIGYPGFIIFMIIIYSSIRSFWKTSRKDPKSSEDGDLILIGGCALIGFSGHLVGVFFLSQAYGMQFTFFFVLAAVFERFWAKMPADNPT
jgi:O-antigen ligase